MAPPFALEDCIRDRVESALAAPRAGFEDHEEYPTLLEKAAVLFYHVVRAHACGNGNKRLAFILLSTFLTMNGKILRSDSREQADYINEIAAGSERGQRPEAVRDLTTWLETAIVPPEQEGANG